MSLFQWCLLQCQQVCGQRLSHCASSNMLTARIMLAATGLRRALSGWDRHTRVVSHMLERPARTAQPLGTHRGMSAMLRDTGGARAPAPCRRCSAAAGQFAFLTLLLAGGPARTVMGQGTRCAQRCRLLFSCLHDCCRCTLWFGQSLSGWGCIAAGLLCMSNSTGSFGISSRKPFLSHSDSANGSAYVHVDFPGV
jgi:hypothetical protein